MKKNKNTPAKNDTYNEFLLYTTNLQPPPPHWNKERIINYRDEARLIVSELRDGNEYLARRLEGKIGEYGRYINGYKR